jgi:hypothetical protein
MKKFLPLLALTCLAMAANGQTYWSVQKGSAHFKSEAPLELIQARTTALRGLISPGEQTFAFSVNIASFQGFNSPLQQEHFNENYMESALFPDATFSGRIIEQVDLLKPGEYSIRAKGILVIHGIASERIIRCKVVVGEKECRIYSSFTVPLSDHGINIPKVVHQKIAEEIEVTVEAVLVMLKNR